VNAGRVVSIHVAPARGAPTISVSQARAVPGKGLVGGPHFGRSEGDPGLEATLIEVEAVEALARGYDVRLEPGDARRNIVIRGVALNHLVERQFAVGEVALFGLRLCEPCVHLTEFNNKGVLRGPVDRSPSAFLTTHQE
jgi:MOSC domain-containing protein YiiM